MRAMCSLLRRCFLAHFHEVFPFKAIDDIISYGSYTFYAINITIDYTYFIAKDDSRIIDAGKMGFR